MQMTSLGILTGAAFKSSKRVAAIVATGLALATASVSSQAVEVVVGTLDVTPTPFGIDLLAYDFSSGNYAFTVVGSPMLSLFTTSYSPISPITSGVPGVTTYSFAGLSGSYLISLFGAPSAPYTLVMSGTGTITPTAVPEPESYVLALAGLGAVGTLMRRRRNSDNNG
ncbi:PEP-CTERM sorting domain-containing protein [Aquabacterium sp.]|uniref:PEP-CTERM sorting domain-containing protein n=1 Tax=Aquabacterium sp. TaxID=1872578 RepID=UPI0019A0452C|nr:PEP-CTERM sorting domain-containing protein [Aquabacterium sp.]MBC7700373.1 PEP-CTERM sorting domain-containing protein [Aquabacterium sp.]